eukprot:2059462-Pyramimonas_sp.AAC.1
MTTPTSYLLLLAAPVPLAAASAIILRSVPPRALRRSRPPYPITRRGYSPPSLLPAASDVQLPALAVACHAAIPLAAPPAVGARTSTRRPRRRNGSP